MNTLKIKSLFLYLAVVIVNAGLFYCLLHFRREWWAFAPIFMMGTFANVWYIIGIGIHRLFMVAKGWPVVSVPKEPIVYLVTAYNETVADLYRTIDSLAKQDIDPDIASCIVIVVDGEKDLARKLRTHAYDDVISINDAYEDWHDAPKNVTILSKKHMDKNIVFLIKHENAGKQDGLVLARSLAYSNLFPGEEVRHGMKISAELELTWNRIVPKATRMFGVDADTVFKEGCTRALLEEMSYPGERPVDGVVGYIEVDRNGDMSPYQMTWVWFQSVGYVIAQHLMRIYQSRVTEKVTCLSGACYGVYVPTMCHPEHLREWNTPPGENAGLFANVIAYASEDRRACALALGNDRTVRFRQALNKDGIAYTMPPASLAVYLSQQRRWALGAAANNWWMFAHGKSMYMTERIFAFFQVLSFLLAPLYLMTNVLIVYVIIKDFDTMLVFISIPMLAVYAYNLIIPTWSPCFNTTWSRFTYYPKLVISVVYAPWILTLVQANSLLKSYLISWGKTIKVTHDYDEAAPQNVISNA